MASTIATEKLTANQKVQMFWHDPDSIAAEVLTPDKGVTRQWFDLQHYGNFLAMAMTSLLAGAGVTRLEIVAADDQAGTNLTVIKDSGVVAADAVGDYVVLECMASEVRELGADLRYVAARLTVANAGDEAVVTYIGGCPRFAESGLTANAIS